MLKIYDVPNGEELSGLYTVRAGADVVPVRFCRVSAMPYNTVWPGHQRPLDQTEEAAFVNFATDGPVTLEVEPSTARLRGGLSARDEIVVRPLSKSAKAVIRAGILELTLPGPGFYTLEINGFHNCLHIFADGQETHAYAKDAERATYRFEHGVFDAGLITLRSGESLYIGEDAVVYGSVVAEDAENVRIFGGGVLDNSRFLREDPGCLIHGTMHLTRCVNAVVEGITFRDSSAWTVTAIHCDNVIVRHVKLIGMWRYNSDGIDLVNSRNCIVRDSFLRNFDDAVVLKGLKQYDSRNVELIFVEGCTIWCDWGRALEIGAETCADEYRNILFRDCDIIHGDCILMDLQNGDRASVHHVIFEDIRCEYTRRQLRPVYQSDMSAPYCPGKELFVPVLFKAHLYCGLWSNDNLYGENHTVLLDNISITAEDGVDIPGIVLQGVNAAHRTYDITVRNLTFNGRRLSAEEIPLEVNAFAEAPLIE
ncbi:MAG: hypothetical protein IJM24_11105 [Clostridia bacterium]|nr:hypothetical protein [Clostridia bacterium]